jgi:hypothetical protein
VGYQWKALEKGFPMSYTLSSISTGGPGYREGNMWAWIGPEQAWKADPSKVRWLLCHPHLSKKLMLFLENKYILMWHFSF